MDPQRTSPMYALSAQILATRARSLLNSELCPRNWKAADDLRAALDAFAQVDTSRAIEAQQEEPPPATLRAS